MNDAANGAGEVTRPHQSSLPMTCVMRIDCAQKKLSALSGSWRRHQEQESIRSNMNIEVNNKHLGNKQ